MCSMVNLLNSVYTKYNLVVERAFFYHLFSIDYIYNLLFIRNSIHKRKKLDDFLFFYSFAKRRFYRSKSPRQVQEREKIYYCLISIVRYCSTLIERECHDTILDSCRIMWYMVHNFFF